MVVVVVVMVTKRVKVMLVQSENVKVRILEQQKQPNMELVECCERK